MLFRSLYQIQPNEGRKPEPVMAVIMGQHEADKDETAGEPANDHFHRFLFGLMKAAGYQYSNDQSVKGTDNGIARQRTSPR